jgi:hypothetical protein
MRTVLLAIDKVFFLLLHRVPNHEGKRKIYNWFRRGVLRPNRISQCIISLSPGSLVEAVRYKPEGRRFDSR